MKTNFLKSLLAIACLLCSIAVYAHDFEVDGIYYNKLSSTKVEVSCRGNYYDDYNNEYKGSIVIPASITYNGTTYSVTSIGMNAFCDCTGLTSVTIGNSVTSIGNGAFSGCTGLTSVTIPNSVTSIGSSAFAYCTGLTEVTIPNSVTSIGNSAFSGCTGLTSVTIPNSVTSIGNSAFYGCTGLTSVTIPNSVTSIGAGAFSGCTGLTSIVVDKDNQAYDSRDNCNAIIETASNTLITGCKNTVIPNSVTSIGNSAFSGCTGLTSVTIPNSVTSIGNSAFSGCTGLTSVTIPNSVTSIGNSAFSRCTGLTEVTIPNSVTSIGERAFLWCEGLTEVTIGNSVTSIGNSAFSGCTGLTSVTIPNSVTSIGEYAFRGCTGLTSVTIGKSVTEIGSHAFDNCDGLTSMVVEEGNTVYDSRDNCNAIIETASNTLITGCKNTVIPNSVTSIGEYAFYGCTGLTEVTIGNSVTSIGEYAFYGCTGLTSFTIGNSVTSIGSYAFAYCTGLTEVTIPNSVTWIGYSAFSDCTGLTTVNFNAENCNTMSSSSNPVFDGCTNLSTINIGENVKTIPSSTFSGCTGLKEVTIPNSVTSIDDRAFYNCVALRTVTIGSDVTEIGDYAFDKCDRIKEIYAHPTVPPVIGSHTFTVYVSDNATLYLYKESQEAYAKADYWEYFVKIGTIKKEYTLTYMVDDMLYAQEYYFEGDTITPIAEPEKENYTFSGWSEIPEIMPSHDVTVTGSFMEVVFDSVINDTVSSFIVNKEMYCDELIYIRDFDNTDWQAWYVPFEVDYTTIAYDFEVACINNVHQYDQNNDGEMDLTELEAVKMKEGVLKANYPYIVKAHSTGVKQVILNNVSLQPTEVCSIDCSSVSLRYTFTGTYNAMTGSELMQNGCYALQYNMLEAPTEESALGAFRWYMQIEQRSGDNNAVPQCIVLKVKEDFTDIENVMNNTDNAPVEYYDLSGRRVVEPTSGIYIVKQGNTVRKVVINK